MLREKVAPYIIVGPFATRPARRATLSPKNQKTRKAESFAGRALEGATETPRTPRGARDCYSTERASFCNVFLSRWFCFTHASHSSPAREPLVADVISDVRTTVPTRRRRASTCRS
ncbi:hypothetical protein EVAR_65560_1 [Eumeta japonica]|uniref:Uncharacterized protein n=1 Tax=Eumeta variegata TaxID=151549 RepID=A0A4C1ZDF9_EUMVA|nr:hypothetical protein EVAR_65560_1 [Eumeta japonica]